MEMIESETEVSGPVIYCHITTTRIWRFKTAIILSYALIVWIRSRGRVGLVRSHTPLRAVGGR